MRKLILILFIGILASCSTENEEFLELSNENSVLENTVKNSNIGVIDYENKIVVIKSKDRVARFSNGVLDHHIVYSNLNEIEVNNTNNEVRINNTITREFMIFKNIVNVDSKTIVFDVQTSEGIYYENIKYQSNTTIAKCPWCWIVPVITKAVTDILEDDYDSNCASAIEACGSAGVDSVEIIDGGWFGESSCTVTCK